MEKRFVYADNAATTKVSKPVLDVMMPYFTEEYGNASSIYALGRSAKKALETARETVAKAIGAETSEIYFTSCVRNLITGLSVPYAKDLPQKAKNISLHQSLNITLYSIHVRHLKNWALK